jgi:hypothetical protein
VLIRAVNGIKRRLKRVKVLVEGEVQSFIGRMESRWGVKPVIKICISTTKGYAPRTISPLINQLIASGIDSSRIYVFEGGYQEDIQTGSEPNYFQVSHNSFDMTALIGVLDFGLESDYWLLLHDTLRLDPTFRKRFESVRFLGQQCLPLRKSPSMNIGFYEHNYLLKNREAIVSFRNVDFSFEGLQSAKRIGVDTEDFLFKMPCSKQYINPHLSFYESKCMGDFEGSTRFMERYPQLGLIKYKANNERANQYRIGL